MGRASDHLDGPRTTADPAADIADVFAFTSPAHPNRLVFAMTLWPFASPSATFSTQVDYVFRVRRVAALRPLTLDTVPLDITCAFDQGDDGSEQVSCSGPGGSASATVDAPSMADSPMRIFVGHRADPAFFDRLGALATLAGGRLSFTGQNAFAGANVLAIVIELDADAFRASGAPLSPLAVAAETIRRGR
jgi:hypothetical protein